MWPFKKKQNRCVICEGVDNLEHIAEWSSYDFYYHSACIRTVSRIPELYPPDKLRSAARIVGLLKIHKDRIESSASYIRKHCDEVIDGRSD
jgi:hypothetical protein